MPWSDVIPPKANLDFYQVKSKRPKTCRSYRIQTKSRQTPQNVTPALIGIHLMFESLIRYTQGLHPPIPLVSRSYSVRMEMNVRANVPTKQRRLHSSGEQHCYAAYG